MKLGDIVKNAPNSLIWAVTLAFLGVLGAFVYLSATGSDSTDLRTFLNTTLNIIAAIFSGGALVVAGSAAHSAGKADVQTNGQLAELSTVIENQEQEITQLRNRLGRNYNG